MPPDGDSTKEFSASAGSRFIANFFCDTATAGRRRLFQVERNCALLLEVLYAYRQSGGFLLHDFVFMPDHLHLLMTLPATLSIEKAVQLIKGGFSFRAGKELQVQSPIWERGFSEVRIYDGEGFQARSKYIRDNPVRAGLREGAVAFSYCSSNPRHVLDEVPTHLRG